MKPIGHDQYAPPLMADQWACLVGLLPNEDSTQTPLRLGLDLVGLLLGLELDSGWTLVGFHLDLVGLHSDSTWTLIRLWPNFGQTLVRLCSD
jgi:hypothetical protein